MVQQERHASPKGKTILVVEDHTGIGAFLIDLLQAVTPYHVLLATDGLVALEMVKHLIPDLFLLDYHLPNMSGLELFDQLQETEELRNIPVLLLSADAPEDEIEQRRIASLKKPVSVEQLLQRLKTLLED